MGWTAQIVLALQLTSACFAAKPIGIFLTFKTPPDPAIVDLMTTEILEILRPAELDLTFERAGEPSSLKSFQKIVVVGFRGSCRSAWTIDPIHLDQPATLDYPTLGTTDISDGRIMPYVHVFCNEVRAFVPNVSRMSFYKMYGRALGRVVAHELYHALLETREHTKAGLARPAQTPRDLIREKLSLDNLSLNRLREMWGGFSRPTLSGH